MVPETKNGAGAFGDADNQQRNNTSHVVPDVDLLKRYKVLNDNTIQFEEIDNAFDIKRGK